MPFPILFTFIALSFVIVSCSDQLIIDESLDFRRYEISGFQVRVTSGIEYGKGMIESGDMPLLLDVYEPIDDQNSSRPSLLIIHGGSFLRGSREQDELVKFATEFASRGYLVASMDYRLSDDVPELSRSTQKSLEASPLALREAYQGAGISEKAPWAAFEDAQRALRWLRDADNSFQVDSSRIAVLGASAGALTALKLAYQLEAVEPKIAAPTAITAVWGSLDNDDMSVLNAGEPPLLLIHGTEDKIVSINSSALMYERAQEVGVPVEFVPLKGRGHGLNDDKNDFFSLQVDSGVTVFEKIVSFTNTALFTPSKLPLGSCDSFGDICP